MRHNTVKFHTCSMTYPAPLCQKIFEIVSTRLGYNSIENVPALRRVAFRVACFNSELEIGSQVFSVSPPYKIPTASNLFNCALQSSGSYPVERISPERVCNYVRQLNHSRFMRWEAFYLWAFHPQRLRVSLYEGVEPLLILFRKLFVTPHATYCPSPKRLVEYQPSCRNRQVVGALKYLHAKAQFNFALVYQYCVHTPFINNILNQLQKFVFFGVVTLELIIVWLGASLSQVVKEFIRNVSS